MKKIIIPTLLIFILILSNVIAVETLSVSDVKFYDGATNSWQNRFIIDTTSGFTGSEGKIYAENVKDLETGEYATKDILILNKVKEYTCDYYYDSDNEPISTYYITYAGDRFCGLFKDPCEDKCGSKYFDECDWRSDLNLRENEKANSNWVVYDNGWKYYVIVEKQQYDGGDIGDSIENFKIDFELRAVESGENDLISDTKTINSEESHNIILKDNGKQIAYITYQRGGLETNTECPSGDGFRAIQNFNDEDSSTFQIVDEAKYTRAKNADDNLFNEVKDWYNNNGGTSPNELRNHLNIYYNEPVNIMLEKTFNYLNGQKGERLNLHNTDFGKSIDMMAEGQVKLPTIPKFTIEVQADWVGVIKPEPIPTIEIKEEITDCIVAGTPSYMEIEIGNVGTGEGSFRYYGICGTEAISIEDGYTIDIKPGKTIDKRIRLSSSSTDDINTNCKIIVEYDSKATAQSDIFSTCSNPAVTPCPEGDGSQQCSGNKILQCNNNNFKVISECPSNTQCIDNSMDLSVSKNNAQCKSLNEDECKNDFDCEPILEDKYGNEKICIKPILGNNYCNYKPLNLMACENMIDDDGDGFIDMNDKGCESKKDNDEYNKEFPYLAMSLMVIGLGMVFGFGAVSIKKFSEGDKGFAFAMLFFSILGISLLFWGATLWLGTIISILLIIGISLVVFSFYIIKIPVYGSSISAILILIAIILFMIVFVAIVFKFIDLGTILGIQSGGIISKMFGL